MIFWHGRVCHAPTNKWKTWKTYPAGFFSFFVREVWQIHRKHTKLTKLVFIKTKMNAVQIRGYNFPIETSKIKRGIAVMSLVLITSCLMHRNLLLVIISWWVTNWALQLISIVSLYLQDCLHQFSPWSGTTIFGAVIQVLRGQKCRQKLMLIIFFSFLGYLGEMESDSQSVWTCICTAVVPRSVLPSLKS